MALRALPAVLVQSIMHSMEALEIIALARCCKWTLECADSAFAWRHCSSLPCEWTLLASLPIAPSRLSRFIPVVIMGTGDSLSEKEADRLWTVLQAGLRITGLLWSEWKLSMERGLELLSHPALQSVRDVGLSSGMRAEWLAAAALLPSLTSVDLVGSRLSSADLQPLVHARALRRLYVSEERGECLSVVMQLTQLTMLSILEPRINGDSFVALCTAMRGLQELCLVLWRPEDVRSLSPADLVTGFSSLRSLRTLEFIHSFDARTLAPVLHHAPALRSLRLPEFRCADESTLLARLMRMAPLLRITCERSVDRMALKDARRLLAPMAQ